MKCFYCHKEAEGKVNGKDLCVPHAKREAKW